MTKQPRILIVEDDADWLEIYCTYLKDSSYILDTAQTINQAFKFLDQNQYDAVITDLKLIGFGNEYGGFNILHKVKDICPETQVIIITAYGTQDIAFRAIQQGALAIVYKPPTPEHFKFIASNAIEARKIIFQRHMSVSKTIKRPNSNKKTSDDSIQSQQLGFFGIMGNSNGMKKAFGKISYAIHADTPVFIFGEKGTGKTLIAKTIHSSSKRKNKPFSRVNYDEMIKHWDTVKQNIKNIGGGTFFLDAVSKVSNDDQSILDLLFKSLRDEDIRLISAATTGCRSINKLRDDLHINQKAFNSIVDIPIFIPPLRNRKDGDDIPALAGYFVRILTDEASIEPCVAISPEAMKLLIKHDYSQSNVTELHEVIQRALNLLGGKGEITKEHIIFTLNETKKVSGTNENPQKLKNTPKQISTVGSRIYTYDVFISYSHKNQNWVKRKLLPTLESHEINVAVDFRNFEPGAFFVNEIERAIKYSRKTLIILSQAYLDSEWAEFENVLVQILDPAARQRRLIPILYKNCPLPLRIKALNYIDLTDPNKADFEITRLIKAIKKK
jgi:DNA-binding NtrC family response regulator